MEADTIPNQSLKCPIAFLPKLEMDLKEENDSKIADLYLKCNGKECSSDDEFIESATIERVENIKEELHHKESDICLGESSCIKWETRTFQKIQAESSDRDIDKGFFDMLEPCAIKKEPDDVNEIGIDKINYNHEILLKSEAIEEEEVHIKQEEDNEDKLKKKTSKPRKRIRNRTVLHHCPECAYSTNRKDNLKTHSVKHKKKDEIDWYSCLECSFKTTRKYYLKTHFEIHRSDNLLLKCSNCSYETFRSSEFKKHQLEHKPNVKWLHCSECSFKSNQRWYFRRHLLVHKRKALLKCTKCSYQAKTRNRLTVHQAKHESINKGQSCPLCSFKTFAKNTLLSHCRARHNIDPNTKQIVNFKCTECTFESGCKRTLHKHQMIHNQSNWIQCPDCAYKTPYKRSLKSHQLRHQGENAEGWHMCPECDYKTTLYSSLRRHVMRQHKSADEIRWFECSQCSFKTAHKDSLRTHQFKHKEAQEIEWFCCYECAFKTKYKSDLAKHISKHKKRIW